ncbi:hypothetical protein SALBM217S_07164 [Streptomyces griseoloalbus]
MTSRWVLEVQKQRGLDVRWHLMSLAVLNEDKLDELPAEYREMLEVKAWGPVRVVIAAREEHGPEVLGDLYTALGTRIHNKGEGPGKETVAAALKDVGLPDSLMEHWDATPYEPQLRASHKEGIDKVGQEVGTPVIAVPGPDGEEIPFFGPVVTPAPQGGGRPPLGRHPRAGLRPGLLRDQAHPHEGPGLQQPVTDVSPAPAP